MGEQRHLWQKKQIPHLGLYLILLIFLLLSSLYSIIVPITQGEDELAHYRYIGFIAQHGRLPINHAERQEAWYRADWPPLYHLLVGWAVSTIDTTQPHLKDVGESPRRRLVGEIFYPRLIIYTEDANWPWQDGILAWHLGRFISILFSGVALVFTYLTVLEFCQNSQKQTPDITDEKSPWLPCSLTPLLALSTTALLAFTPRFLFTSAMLGDDSLFILLSAIFIWLLLRALRGDDRWRVYAGLGLLLGLSITTKYSTGLLPLVIIPVVLWRARQINWTWPQWLGRLGLSWLFTLVGSSWWFGWIGYYFNTIKDDGLIFGLLSPLLASGPDVSMGRIFALFTGRQFSGQIRPDAVTEGTFGEWWVYLFQTFWGVPVLEHDPLYPWVYLVMVLFCLLALIGLWQLWRGAGPQTRITLVILGLIVGLLFPFPILRYFLTFNILETGQGRHILYPAAQSIPILLMLGWAQVLATWFNQRRPSLRLTQYAIRFTVYLPLTLLFVWSVFQLAYMNFTYPAPLPVQTTTFDTASVPQPAPHNFSGAIELLGYDFQPDAEQGITHLTLFWKALEPVEENYRTRVQLVSITTGQVHFTWLSHPVNGLYPTRAWDKGDVIRDNLPLPLAGVPPDTYQIQLDLLHEAEDTPLNSEPVHLTQFQLTDTQPLVDASTLTGANPEDRIEYRLWLGKTPLRYRQTIPLSWKIVGSQSNQEPHWVLLGPDNIPRHPVAVSDATAIFMVGADWPSGDYRLGIEGGVSQTEPLLTVANDLRSFELPAKDEGYISVEANFANQVGLLGYVLPTRRVEPGGGLPITLYWQSLVPVLGDYIMFDVLLNDEQQAYGGYDRLPREYYSTILWAEDEIVEDGFAVPVAPDAPPGVYYLHIGLYSLEADLPTSLPLIQDGQPVDTTSVVIGPIKVGGPPPSVTINNPAPQITLNQSFGDQITLLGYDLTGPNSNPETKNLKLTLYWQAETIPSADYTTFLHLRDNNGQNVAQKDQPPANGQYPTSLWDAGEVIIDEITLPLDAVSPGEYTPVVGLYEFTSGVRLPVGNDPNGELQLESIILP